MKINRQKGIIKTIFIFIILLIIVSYMGIDLEEAASKPLFTKNLKYTGEVVKSGWEKYIAGPLSNWFDKKSSTNTETSEKTDLLDNFDDITL